MILTSKSYIIFLMVFFVGIDSGFGQDLSLGSDDLNRQSRFIEAQSQIIIGNNQEAEKIYKDLLKKNPDDHEAAFFIGKLYLDKKDTENAVKYLSLALANQKENPWYYSYAAEAYLENKQYDPAVKTLESQVVQFPGEKQYYDRLEFLYKDSKQFQKQLDLLRKKQARFGFHRDDALGEVQALFSLEEETEAVRILEKLSKNFPKDLFVLNLLANHYQKEGRKEDAKRIYEKIVEIQPGDSRANLALLDYTPKDQSVTDQIRSLKPFFQNKNIDFDTKFSKISPLFRNNLEDLSKEELEVLSTASNWLLESHPNSPKALSLRADLYVKLGNNSDAVKFYQKTVDVHPDNYLVWEQLLWSLKELHRWKDMSHYADEATIYFPNRVVLFLMKGEAEYEMGNPDEAMFDLETALTLGEDDPALKSNILGFMGLVSCISDSRNSGEDFFSQATLILKNNPNIDYYLSICEFKSGHPGEAGKRIDLALSKLPDKPAYLVQKAKILDHTGDYQKILDILTPIADKTYYFPVFEWLGRAYRKLEQPDKADIYDQKAIDYGAPKQKNITN